MSEPFTHVIDASALLCLMLAEAGADRVEAVVDGAALSADHAEVVAKLIERGSTAEAALMQIAKLPLDIVPVDRGLAETAARLRIATRSAGLSLGDRCGLALAQHHGGRAVTCDRAWATLDPALGIAIELVR